VQRGLDPGGKRDRSHHRHVKDFGAGEMLPDNMSIELSEGFIDQLEKRMKKKVGAETILPRGDTTIIRSFFADFVEKSGIPREFIFTADGSLQHGVIIKLVRYAGKGKAADKYMHLDDDLKWEQNVKGLQLDGEIPSEKVLDRQRKPRSSAKSSIPPNFHFRKRPTRPENSRPKALKSTPRTAAPTPPPSKNLAEVQADLRAFRGRLRAIRKRQWLTLAQLGEKSQLWGSQIAAIELDSHIPKFSTCYRLAEGLQITLEELLDAEAPLPLPHPGLPPSPSPVEIAANLKARALKNHRTYTMVMAHQDVMLSTFYRTTRSQGVTIHEALTMLPKSERKTIIQAKNKIQPYTPQETKIKSALEGNHQTPKDRRIWSAFQALRTHQDPQFRRLAMIVRRYLGVNAKEGDWGIIALAHYFGMTEHWIIRLVTYALAILDNPEILTWLIRKKGLAARARDRKEQLGITQGELARRSRLSNTVIRNILTGKTPDPRLSTLVSLASGLETNVNWLALELGDAAPLPRESGSFADRVQKNRMKRKFSPRQLAILIGISDLSEIETGKLDPQLNVLLRLAWALRKTPGYLAAGERAAAPAAGPASRAEQGAA
jgi:transcriptional regulator with XRE-family HTH domain